MFKKIFAGILLTHAFYCQAQTTFDAGGGAEIAANFYHSPDKFVGITYPPGLSISPGISLKLNIKNKVSIGSGIVYLYELEKVNGITITDISGHSLGTAIFLTRYRYISIPVQLSYNFLKSTKINAGIMALSNFSHLQYQSFTLPGQLVNGVEIKNERYYTANDDSGYVKINIAVGAGAFVAYNITPHFNVMAYPFFRFDLDDPIKGGKNYFTTFGLGVNVYYRFGKVKQDK